MKIPISLALRIAIICASEPQATIISFVSFSEEFKYAVNIFFTEFVVHGQAEYCVGEFVGVGEIFSGSGG